MTTARTPHVVCFRKIRGAHVTLAPAVPCAQVTIHLRMRDASGAVTTATECYECKPAPMPKSFPVCTIRNTPDRPIHCIVWAKDLLFARLFGPCAHAMRS